MIYTEHEYLAHHGVDKQKWGHRNGPPYPLDPEQMTSAQKKANANEGWFKRKIREAKEAKQAKKEAKIAKKEEEKAAKQAHKQGRLSEQERKDVYNRADVKTAYEHISEYSNREIQSIMDRYEMQQALSQKVANISYKEKMKGKEKIDVAAKYLDSVVNIGRKAADIYNIAAAVGNALGDKQWKPIRIGEFPKGNKNKDDNEFESKLSDEKKNKLFKSGDVNEAKKYKEELTNKELQSILDRHYKYQALDKAVDKANKSDNDDYSDNKSNNKKQNNQNQNSYKKSYDNNYKKSYDNDYSKSSDTKSSSYDSKKNAESTKTVTEKKKSSNVRGTKNQSWSIVGSTSGNYSNFLSDNASSGESWVSTYFDNYSKPKTRSSLSTNTKTSYSDNHVKDSSGNTYRMITTSPTGLTGVDKNYVTSGENWFSNWSASYDVYDDKKK